MRRWPSFNITQQFLVFFVLTSILPISIISALVFQAIDSRFSERIIRMLDIGTLFAEEVYQNDLEKLTLSTNQVAYFSLYREYHAFRRSRNLPALEKALNAYKELRNLEILRLYDRNGNEITHVNTTSKAIDPRAHAAMLAEAYDGKTVHSVERVKLPSGENRLEYISVSPIFSEQEGGGVAGVLLAGQAMVANFSLQDLVRALPEMDVRIYSHTDVPGEYALLFSSIPGAGPRFSADRYAYALTTAPPGYTLAEGDSRLFRETIDNVGYRSRALQLRNFLNEPIGLMVVSSSEIDLLELQAKNLLYIVTYVLLGLVLVGLAGYWFKASFINPVNRLALAADSVAKGKLDFQVSEESGQKEIRKTIASFNAMVAQLKEDERLRSTFVSTLTHDLRTPLIAQKRVLELYDEFGEELPAELRDMNRGLLRNNTHLLDMVNKLLEVYKYEAGKIALVPEWFDLADLVDECFDEIRPLAEQKNITLENGVKPDTGRIRADRYQLKRVFQNLIGNALENIQDNRKITVQAASRPGSVEMRVIDNGPGIKPELLPLLFTRYFTGDRLRQKIGSGLGLYICRMIVEQHGGRIAADSEPGRGTAVTFEIPQPLSEEV